MKERSFLLLLLLLPIFLAALEPIAGQGIQHITSEYDSLIVACTQSLDANPADLDARIQRAYYFMLTNRPLLALRDYRSALETAPGNKDASAGVLWALNNLKAYDISLQTAKKLTRQEPDEPAYHIHRAYAYLKTGGFSQARHHYHTALENEPFNFQNREIAYDGLGWAYLMLGDYWPAAENFYKAQTLNHTDPDLYGSELLNELKLKTAAGFTRPQEDKLSFMLSQEASYKAALAGFKWEEFHLSQKYYRRILQAKAGFQTSPLNLKAIYNNLDGVDEDIYPAHVYTGIIEPKLYLKHTLLIPRLRLNYSQYASFDVHQYDLNPSLIYGKWNFAPSLRYVYTDSEIVGRDDEKLIFAMEISRDLFRGVYLGAYYSNGNEAWVIDNYHNVIDTTPDLADDYYYGFSVYIPFGEYISLVQYNQFNNIDKDTKYLFHMRLEVSW